VKVGLLHHRLIPIAFFLSVFYIFAFGIVANLNGHDLGILNLDLIYKSLHLALLIYKFHFFLLERYRQILHLLL